MLDKQGQEALRTTGHDTNWYRTQFAGGATPRNELVITVSAMSPQQVYLARNTRVYYTADADAPLYFCPGDATLGARTWMIPVRGDCTGPRCMDEAQRSR